MIVSRKSAEEAAAVFGFDLESGLLAKDQVQAAYKAMAKTAHPDGGGSLEAFAAVDRAKHVLLAWLDRRVEAPVPDSTDCEPCGGTGKVTLQRGFGQMTVTCRACNGTGDGNYDHDTVGE